LCVCLVVFVLFLLVVRLSCLLHVWVVDAFLR
jgi:hypothetical protein